MTELTEGLLPLNETNQEDQDVQAALHLTEDLDNLPNLDKILLNNCSGVYAETQCKDDDTGKTLSSHCISEKMFHIESDPDENVLSKFKSHLDNDAQNEHMNFPSLLTKPDVMSTNKQSMPFVGDSFGKKVAECKSQDQRTELDVIAVNDSDILSEKTQPAKVLNDIKQHFTGLSWVYSSGEVTEDFPTQETNYISGKTNCTSVTLSSHSSTPSKPYTSSQNNDSHCVTPIVEKNSPCEKFPEELISSKTDPLTSSNSEEMFPDSEDPSPNSVEIASNSKETSSCFKNVPLDPKIIHIIPTKETSYHFKDFSSVSEEVSTNSKTFSSNFEKTNTNSEKISSNSEILPDCAEALLSPKRNSFNSEEASPHSNKTTPNSKGIALYSETVPSFKDTLADFKQIIPYSKEIVLSSEETSLDKEISPTSEITHNSVEIALNFNETLLQPKETFVGSKETSLDSERILHDSKESSCASEGILHDSKKTLSDSEKITYDLREDSPDSEGTLHDSKQTSPDLETSSDSKEILHCSKELTFVSEEISHDSKETSPDTEKVTYYFKENSPDLEGILHDSKQISSDSDGISHYSKETSNDLQKTTHDSKGTLPDLEETLHDSKEISPNLEKTIYDPNGISPVPEGISTVSEDTSSDLKKASPDSDGTLLDWKTSPDSNESSPNVFFPKGKIYNYAEFFGIQKFSLLESTSVDINLKTPTPDERHKWRKMDRKYIQKECYRIGISPGTFYSSNKGYFVEVPNGVNYDIILTNENPVPCNVDVFIDNGATPAICFRLNPGAPKKFDGPTSCLNKFVFLRSKDAPSESGIKAKHTNGLIEAVFTPQKIETLRTRTVSEPIALSRSTSNILDLVGIDKVTRKLRSYTTGGSVERGVDISNFCQGATALRGEQSQKRLKEADAMEVDEAKKVIIRLRLVARVDDPSVPYGDDICSMYPPSVEELLEN